MSEKKIFKLEEVFDLESGGVLRNAQIAYHTFGTLNKERDNVIWVCHALTANSNVPEWWGGLAGPDGLLNTDDYFIVCANMLGSCYGSTGPGDIDSKTDNPYYYNFPLITMRDVVRAHLLLKDYLGINEIFLCMGGSCGGNQVLEFCLQDNSIKNSFIIASSAKESPWSIAIHTTQRRAIENDSTWGHKDPEAGIEGLKVARGIGLLTYRTIDAYNRAQLDDDEVIENFKASSYIDYQGEKLAKRFTAHSYWHLTKTLDTHNIARGRGRMDEVLSSIQARMLIIGIDTDILIPVAEQQFIANHVKNSEFALLESAYGHDGFLIEQEKIKSILDKFLNNN